MMKFSPLASSSHGNAYLVRVDGASPLLLEAGLPINRLRDKFREYGIRLSEFAGCLTTHEHMDHAKAVNDLLRAGVDVWMSYGTAMERNSVGHHRLHIVTEDTFRIDQWEITPFDLEHDAAEPKGFLITHGDEHLLFAPDTASIKDRFEGITIIAVEANNISELLSHNILEGYIPAVVGKRVGKTHMSLENLLAMLKATDLSHCREIWLLHLSSGNSDEEEMKKQIQEVTGIPVYIAAE